MPRVFALILFAVFALRPAYNVGYTLYFQWNIDAIVQKYCVNKEKPALQCNGKCHLSKKLLRSSPSPEKNDEDLAVLVEAFFPQYYESSIIAAPEPDRQWIPRHPIPYFTTYWELFRFSEDPPPRV